jgi:DNA-binding MarR family transcriptional regulator
LQSDIAAGGRLAAELVPALLRVRRLTRQRIRSEWGSPPLPEAQLELLRLLRKQPGMRVREAAELLGVAPNTVSTLVRQLGAAGLLERQTDAADGRATRLHLTAAASARFVRWRDRQHAIVGAAIASLGETDRRRLADALPALQRLGERLADGAAGR